jgi:glycerate kinase
MAAAAGLRLVPASMRDPGATTTYGVGELIRAALDAGATRIMVGCGDSGTCDGGAGALQALGVAVLDRDGVEVGRGGTALSAVDRVDVSGLDARLAEVDILVACNPHNVLTGPRGVARVFGPQKGASPEQVDELSAAMSRWAEVLGRDCAETLSALGLDPALGPGTGASGGLGAALAAGVGASLRSRFDVLLDHVDLDGLLRRADLVLTAEGAVDVQSARGKVPAEIARRSKLFGKPVIALAGTLGEDAESVYGVGVDAIVSILPGPMGLSEAVADAPRLVTEATERTLRLLTVGAAMSAGWAAQS